MHASDRNAVGCSWALKLLHTVVLSVVVRVMGFLKRACFSLIIDNLTANK